MRRCWKTHNENVLKIEIRKYWICSIKCRSTEANRSISYQPKLNEKLFGDKCPRGLRVHQVEKWIRTRLQISKHQLIYQRENWNFVHFPMCRVRQDGMLSNMTTNRKFFIVHINMIMTTSCIHSFYKWSECHSNIWNYRTYRIFVVIT